MNAQRLIATDLTTLDPVALQQFACDAQAALAQQVPADGEWVLAAIEAVRNAELFEDGVEADLSGAGVTTLAEAAQAGRMAALDELQDELRERLAATPQAPQPVVDEPAGIAALRKELPLASMKDKFWLSRDEAQWLLDRATASQPQQGADDARLLACAREYWDALSGSYEQEKALFALADYALDKAAALAAHGKGV